MGVGRCAVCPPACRLVHALLVNNCRRDGIRRLLPPAGRGTQADAQNAGKKAQGGVPLWGSGRVVACGVRRLRRRCVQRRRSRSCRHLPCPRALSPPSSPRASPAVPPAPRPTLFPTRRLSPAFSLRLSPRAVPPGTLPLRRRLPVHTGGRPHRRLCLRPQPRRLRPPQPADKGACGGQLHRGRGAGRCGADGRG